MIKYQITKIIEVKRSDGDTNNFEYESIELTEEEFDSMLETYSVFVKGGNEIPFLTLLSTINKLNKLKTN